jgi:hypothetical protein
MSDKLNVTALSNKARRYGLSVRDIADIIRRWGPSVLKLIVSGLENGLSFAFLKEILTTLGVGYLQDAVQGMQMKRYARKPQPGDEDCPNDCECYDESEGGSEEEAEDATVDAEALGAPSPSILEGEQVVGFDAGNVLLELVSKFLPKLVEKYGQQLLEYLVAALLKALNDPTKQQTLVVALRETLTEL